VLVSFVGLFYTSLYSYVGVLCRFCCFVYVLFTGQYIGDSACTHSRFYMCVGLFCGCVGLFCRSVYTSLYSYVGVLCRFCCFVYVLFTGQYIGDSACTHSRFYMCVGLLCRFVGLFCRSVLHFSLQPCWCLVQVLLFCLHVLFRGQYIGDSACTHTRKM